MRKFKGSSDFLTNASPDAPAPRGNSQRDIADGVRSSGGERDAAASVEVGQSQHLSGNDVLQTLGELGKGATPSGLAKKLGTDTDQIDELLAQLARERLIEEEDRSGTAESIFSLSSVGQRLMRYRKMARF